MPWNRMATVGPFIWLWASRYPRWEKRICPCPTSAPEDWLPVLMRPLHPPRKVVLILDLQIRKKKKWGFCPPPPRRWRFARSGVGLRSLHSNRFAGDCDVGTVAHTWGMLHNHCGHCPGDTSCALLILGCPAKPTSTLVMSAKCPRSAFTEEVYLSVPLHLSDPDPRRAEPKFVISL